MTPRILVVIGTTIADSFNHSLAAAYADTARDAGAEVRVIDLAVDPAPDFPRDRASTRMPREGDPALEPHVADYIASVEWADHVAVFYPQWWGSQPAAFKAFIDGVFLSGFAFKYTGSNGWDRLLAGRTGRIITTMDSPGWWNLAVYWRAADVTMSRAIFWYCGIKNLRTTRLANVRGSRPATRDRWIRRAARLGASDGARAPRAARAGSRDRAGVLS